MRLLMVCRQMRAPALLAGASLFISGCTTNSAISYSDPRSESTLKLCRTLTASADQQYRIRIAEVLARRSVTAEKCLRLIQNDNSMARGIAIAGVAVAAGAAANGGGGYYSPTDYDYAWDYQPGNGQWACRGKQTGRYAYPYNCQYDPVNDFTWPG